ncbi:MAG: type IV pilin [Thermoplasmata archaeon]|nr:type IV pilin [Thermoplasmata archaeon]MCI4359113.1 type IV pilin [Thermoplasmata archaeon]
MKNGIGNSVRWRKQGKRGVSPIIATILLVAITVVLAAVLYVLISGLTRGPGNTPIGSAFASGTGQAGTSYVQSAVTYYPVTFSVQSASSGVTANSLKFQLQNSGSTIQTYSFVALIDVSGCWVGTFTAAAGWTTGLTIGAAGTAGVPAGAVACAGGTPGLTTQISSGDQLDMVVPTTSPNGAGFSMVIIGTGSYSGTINAAIP